MHWMLLVVSLNLVLWWREARGIASVIVIGALAVVMWSTSAGYLYASGSTFEEYVAMRVDRSVLVTAGSGERLCIARQPFTFLYAPLFHRRTDYAVQEATSAADCKGAREP